MSAAASAFGWVKMAFAIGRKADHVRVLSDLSGLVVGALLDDVEEGREDDAFADALRRYRDEGAPDLTASWRRVIPSSVSGDRTAEVLRHLTRDLLKGVSTPPDRPTRETAAAVDAPPPNVRPIADAREIPALELASDGTWRPSGSSISAQGELDASARRRSIPSLRSRYVKAAVGAGLVLPPAPAVGRFTQVTTPPAAPERHETVVSEPAPVVTSGPAPAPSPADAPAVRMPLPLVDRESVIKTVSGGTEVIAGPFARFHQLAAFVKAVRALPGVQDVTTRQFVRGMVHLRVRHSHAVALDDRLGELTEFRTRVVSSTRDRIELTVEPPDDAPPARA
jgi:hypothetical protein